MASDDETRGVTELRALLVAGYRQAHAAPASRSDRVLARLRRAGDELSIVVAGDHVSPRLAALGRASPVVDLRAPPRSLLLVLAVAIAAAVLAVFALEALTGSLAYRTGERRHDAAVDGVQPRDAGIGGLADHRAPPAGHRRPSARANGPTVPPPPGDVEAIAPAALPPAELPALAPSAPPVQVPSAAVPSLPLAPRRVTPAAPPAATAVASPPEDPGELLLVRARKAMDHADWDEAARALEQHAREFPDSSRAHAREAFRIIVECRRAPGPESRARARDFIVQQARSPHVRKVVAACRASQGVVSPFDASEADAAEVASPSAPSGDPPAP